MLEPQHLFALTSCRRGHVPRPVCGVAVAFVMALLLCFGFGPAANAQLSQKDPEGAGDAMADSTLTGAVGQSFMISTANPHASQAGYDMLARGGNAIDAAIAAQMVLNLVEPQSSGLGGGGFLLYYDGKKHKLSTFDGRERAPKAATPRLFLGADGKFMGWMNAFASGRSTGVPGALLLLKTVHDKYGKLPWATLFEPAISLSENGFEVSPRLADLLAQHQDHVVTFDDTKAYFYPDGKPLAAGTALKNPKFGATLRLIAAEGVDPFYKGALADEIVARVHRAIETSDFPDYGGMVKSDLEHYRVVKRAPVCGGYRGYTVCGMGPPSSGGVTVLQILGMLDHFDMGQQDGSFLKPVHLFAEAQRRAFADRNYYLGDSDFVRVPLKAMLNAGYLKARAASIDPDRVTLQVALPGHLPGEPAPLLPAPPTPEGDNTSHLSIVDGDGNAVAFTTTIETAFGSRMMVGGFLLNNQLTDFNFTPEENGRPAPNAPGPGKRPLSSMSPTMVFRPDGSLYMLIGSPGGKRIIGYVAKTIIGVIDWDLSLREAIDFPHIINTNGATDLENLAPVNTLAGPLEKMGHTVELRDMSSGLHGILITKDGIVGAADPRREGVALGE